MEYLLGYNKAFISSISAWLAQMTLAHLQ